MPKRKNSDHVKIKNEPDGNPRIFCTRCGAAIITPLPMDLTAWVKTTKAFANAHATCQESHAQV